MSFANLPPQPPIFPVEAEVYAQTALERSEAALSRCTRVADQAYGADYWQSVDVYPPRNSLPGGSPVLVFAHGGAWTNGYKEWIGLMAPALTAANIALVSVSYRLAPVHKCNEMVDDCLAALAWVHRNIHRHGGDPYKMAVGGHSAGGHLMMLAALQQDRLREFNIPQDAILACLPLCAPLDVRYPERQPGSGEERTHQVLLNDSSEAAQASPICHVRPGMPFTLLTYAANDLPRIIRSNQAMALELQRSEVRHEVLVLDGEDHFSAALAVEDDRSIWTKRVTRLLLESHESPNA